MLGAQALAAQAPSPSQSDSTRLVIRAVEIDRSNVFAGSEASLFLLRWANKLHVVTQPWVIRKELLFKPGDLYDSARVEETARNLRGMGVFRMVRIDSVRTDSGLVLRVTTADAWSTRLEPRFGSTGGQVSYSLAFGELNLLGTGTLLDFRYRKTPDRTNFTTLFRRPRLLFGQVGLTAQYDNRSDGRAVFGQIDKPYFTLVSKSSWSLSVDSRDERILQFYNGDWATAGDSLQHRFEQVVGAAGWAISANSRGYMRAGFLGAVRREDFADRARPDTIGATVSGTVGGFFQWRRARYVVLRGFSGFARDEDVDLSTIVQVGVNLTPEGFGYRDNGFAPNLSIQTGIPAPRGFIRLTAIATGRITEAGTIDSGTVMLGGTAVFRPTPTQTAVLHGSAGWHDHSAPGTEFDLGLALGPRAFRQHAFTGDRAFLLSAEYRYRIVDEFLRNAGVGLAAFADYGGAWYAGSGRRTGLDFGVGVRFGLTRTTSPETVRIDLARLVGNDVEKSRWVFVIGRGFAFSLTNRLDQ